MVNGRPTGGKLGAPKAPAGVDPDEPVHPPFMLRSSIKGGCTGSSGSTHVEIPKCWISRHSSNMGGQWLSGRGIDSRTRDREFEPQRRHCYVSLSKNNNPSLVLVQPMEDPALYN